jgi:hypothetical protein
MVKATRGTFSLHSPRTTWSTNALVSSKLCCINESTKDYEERNVPSMLPAQTPID